MLHAPDLDAEISIFKTHIKVCSHEDVAGRQVSSDALLECCHQEAAAGGKHAGQLARHLVEEHFRKRDETQMTQVLSIAQLSLGRRFECIHGSDIWEHRSVVRAGRGSKRGRAGKRAGSYQWST